MANMVTKVGEYTTPKNIMIAQDSYYVALPIVLSGTAGATIKAGQPLAGNILKRDTAFTVPSGSATAVGMNLHDVKLDSDGKGNGTLVIVGCVDALKLDTAVATALKSANLSKIVIVEGSAI